MAGLQRQLDPSRDDRTEYEARNVFWIPPESRWAYLQKNAKQANVGRLIDDAMVAIERDNPTLKGVLPKNYNSRDLDRHRLGELIDLISTIALTEAGNDASRSRDILDRLYYPGRTRPLLCPKSSWHHVRPWNHPDRCPKCGTTIKQGAEKGTFYFSVDSAAAPGSLTVCHGPPERQRVGDWAL